MEECPIDALLLNFLHSKLTADESESLASHVGSCEACQQRLAVLNDDADVRRWNKVYHELFTGDYQPPKLDPRLIERQRVAAKSAMERIRFGQYEISGILGHGGMGVVCRAQHGKLRRWHAVKLISPGRLTNPRAIQRFEREMEAIGKLNHPHVVTAYDAGEIEGWHYLAMELVDGCDVEAIARLQGPLSVCDACEIVRQAALGIDHAHRSRLIHRDVKPTNLLLSCSGTVKVADLGLSTLFDDGGSAERLTKQGEVLGTADYMAPEQGLHTAPVGVGADIYGLGCTLFRLLVGHPPYSDSTRSSVLDKLKAHASAPVPRARRCRDDIPEPLDDLIAQLLAKNVEQRPGSAAQLAESLETFTTGADLAALVDEALVETDEFEMNETTRSTLEALRKIQPGWSDRPPRRWRQWRVALMVPVVLATVIFGLFVAPRIFDRSAPSFTAADAQGVYPLLQRLPRPAPWSEARENNSNLIVDLSERRIFVGSWPQTALPLGSVTGRDYTFSVDLQQNQWQGGIGIFFGARQISGDREPTWVHQSIELRPRDTGDNLDKFPFHLTRSRFVLIVKENGDIFPMRNDKLMDVPLETPSQLGETLEIVVTDGKLVRVRWGGVDIDEMCTPAMNTGMGEEDYWGEFGVLNNWSDSTFRRPSIQLR